MIYSCRIVTSKIHQPVSKIIKFFTPSVWVNFSLCTSWQYRERAKNFYWMFSKSPDSFNVDYSNKVGYWKQWKLHDLDLLITLMDGILIWLSEWSSSERWFTSQDHETPTQCCFNAGPSYVTLVQHWIIVSCLLRFFSWLQPLSRRGIYYTLYYLYGFPFCGKPLHPWP